MLQLEGIWQNLWVNNNFDKDCSWVTMIYDIVAWSLPKSELRLGNNQCFWCMLAPLRWNKDSQASVCVTKNYIEQQQLVQLAQISIYMQQFMKQLP